MLRKQAAVLLALLFAAANASIFSANLTSTGCADPDAFLKCQTAASAKSMDCFHHSGAYGQRSGDCFCAMSIDYYNCYATSCWNRAYECEYQQFIMAYLLYCTPAKLPVPYFPAPKDAADACSCNFGQVYQDFRDSMAQGLACMKKVNETGGNAEKLAGCKCCQISGMKSSIWETCPGVFPVDVGSDVVDGAAAQLNKPFSECSAMTKSSCASDFGFSLGGVSTYLAPDQMTVTPAGSPTNKPGAVTTPASGATFTYTNGGDNSTYTITAAAFTGKLAVSSATTSDASGDATASASGAQKTGSKSAGMQVKPSFVLAAVFPLLALLL